MQPDEQRQQNSTNNTFEAPSPPVYPTAEYYRELAAKGPPPNQIVAGPAQTPYLAPVAPMRPAARRMPGRNRFIRFVYNWGGTQRLWLSLGSALVSVFVYAYIFQETWVFGLGLVLLILVHELGHDIALLSKKLPATFPIFIPGIGAFVTLPNTPISLRDDAEISLAGPLAGGIASLACFIMYLITFQPIWADLAQWSFFINLLNLIPVLPLDGGHIGKALSPIMAPIGLVIIGGLYLLTRDIFFLLIGFYGLSGTMGGYGGGNRVMTMRNSDRVVVGVMYGIVAIFLALGFWSLTNSDIFLNILDLRFKLFH